MTARFDELPLEPQLLEALNGMGYHTMTDIQAQAIPKLLTGQDFLGQAPTGTGKTAAFGIPLIQRIKPGTGVIEALILCPTRELAQQITEELNRIGAKKGIQALALYGGENVYVQKEALRQRTAQIIVGTPGRVLDHIGQVSLNLNNTRLVILDEADEMLDMGFRPDIESIFKQLPGGRETWLFSATMSAEIQKIANQYMYYPQEVRIQPQVRSAENIRQWYYISPAEEKHRVLRSLIKAQPEMYGIVFCQTKRDVVLLTRKLRESFPVDCLHGAMVQSDRDKVMEAFRSKEIRLLVSTDIMARGIDVDQLTHVINHSPPQDPESYIHRIGRTARNGETGTAITLFTPQDEYVFHQLQRRVKMSFEKHPDCSSEFEAGSAPPQRNAQGGPKRYGSNNSRGRGPKKSHGRPSSGSNGLSVDKPGNTGVSPRSAKPSSP